MEIINVTKKDQSFYFSGPLGTSTLNVQKLDLSGFYSYKINNDKDTEILWKSIKQNPLKFQGTAEDNKKFISSTSSNKSNKYQSIKNFLNEKDFNVETKQAIKKKNESQKHYFNSLCDQKLKGISRGYFVYLKIVGIGYRVFSEKENLLTFKLGYSHYYQVNLPKSVKAFLPEPTLICLYGIDKNQVTQAAGKLQAIKKPCAYKGKGIRLLDQQIQLKAGKKK